MHGAFSVTCLLLLCVFYAQTFALQQCPSLKLTAKARPKRKRGFLAGRGYVRLTFALRSNENFNDFALKVSLPAGLSVAQRATRPLVKPSVGLQIVENEDESTALYWLGIDFPRNSGGKRLYRTKVNIHECAPEVLLITALAYQVNSTYSSNICATELTNPASVQARFQNGKKSVPCTPTPGPEVSFVPFGLKQRCLETNHLVAFETAQSLISAERPTTASLLNLDTYDTHRLISPATTPSECYTFCSLNGEITAPFFFNWNSVAKQCFCGGRECTTILDEPFTSFKAVRSATSSPTAIPTILPSNFSRVDALSVEKGEDSLLSAVVSQDSAFFGTITQAGFIARINLRNFTQSGTLRLNIGTYDLQLFSAVASGAYAYFGARRSPGVVTKVDLTTFTKTADLTLNDGENILYSAVSSENYAYFGTGTSPGVVVKIDLGNFTRVDALTLHSGENNLYSAVISGNFAYFGAVTSPGVVVKIDLLNFTRVGNITLNTGENEPYSAVVSGRYAYFGTGTSPGIVVKIDLNTFTRVDALTLNSGENGLYSAVVLGHNAYFGTITSPGIVVRLDLTTFRRLDNVTLNAGEDCLYSAVISGDYAYFGTNTAPGKVIKIRM